MKPKKGTKLVSHKEHKGHKGHQDVIVYASGGLVTHFYCISLRRLDDDLLCEQIEPLS